MVEINGTLLFQILNFIILIAILGKFGFAPLMNTLDARRERIRNDLEGAEQARKHAEELKAQYEAQLQDARVQAQDIVKQAIAEAERQTQAQLDAVRAEIDRKKEIAERQLAEEREALVKELRADVVDMSMAVASQLLKQNLDADMNRKLIAECIDKLDKRQVGR